MPIYEHKCPRCDDKFEVMLPMDDCNLPADCPLCGQKADRVFSVVNHTFGFKLTDACNERFGPQCEVERDI